MSYPKEKPHWSKLKEKGNKLGLLSLFLAYRILGRKITFCLMSIVMVYFYLFSKNAKEASKTYFRQLNIHQNKTHNYSTFKHFLSFGESILDKLAVWHSKISLNQIEFKNQNLLLHEINNKKGGVIFTAHLGNIEIARALAKLIPGVKINALVFSEHALNLNRTLKAINPEYDLNLIHIKQPNIALSIGLKEKIDQGEFVVIAADRTSVLNPKQNTKIEFLKRSALFPQGAFILAHLLESKVFLMLCLKEKKAQQFSIYFDLLFEKIVLDRKNRDENLKNYTKTYAKELEKICVSYPYQWFNFYSFWHDNQKESD